MPLDTIRLATSPCGQPPGISKAKVSQREGLATIQPETEFRRILYVDSQTLRVNLLNHCSHEFEAPKYAHTGTFALHCCGCSFHHGARIQFGGCQQTVQGSKGHYGIGRGNQWFEQLESA